MTKAEAFDEAWRLASKGDFSMVDEVYHPDYPYRTGITKELVEYLKNMSDSLIKK